MTGATTMVPDDFFAKRPKFFENLFPAHPKIAVLVNPGQSTAKAVLCRTDSCA